MIRESAVGDSTAVVRAPPPSPTMPRPSRPPASAEFRGVAMCLTASRKKPSMPAVATSHRPHPMISADKPRPLPPPSPPRRAAGRRPPARRPRPQLRRRHHRELSPA